jgi:hypothetical protein
MKTRRLPDFETCSVALFASIVRHDPSLRKARAPRPCAAGTQILPAPGLGNASSADNAIAPESMSAASARHPLNHPKGSISSVRFDRSLIK